MALHLDWGAELNTGAHKFQIVSTNQVAGKGNQHSDWCLQLVLSVKNEMQILQVPFVP